MDRWPSMQAHREAVSRLARLARQAPLSPLCRAGLHPQHEGQERREIVEMWVGSDADGREANEASSSHEEKSPPCVFSEPAALRCVLPHASPPLQPTAHRIPWKGAKERERKRGSTPSSILWMGPPASSAWLSIACTGEGRGRENDGRRGGRRLSRQSCVPDGSSRAWSEVAACLGTESGCHGI